MPFNGQKLKALRLRAKKERGWTVDDVVTKLSFSTSTYWRYERGETQPDAVHITELADVFGTSASYLMDETSDPTPAAKKQMDVTDKEFEALMAWRSGDLKRVMRLISGDD